MAVATPKTAAASFVENVEFITAAHSYHDNTAFGGQLFSWMDSAAAIVVMKHNGGKAVTASIDALYFLRPVGVGMIISVQARLIATFKASCAVRAVVSSTIAETNQRQVIALGYFTMVAIGPNDKPQTVTPLLIESDEDLALAELAQELRRQRPMKQEKLMVGLT